jgi:hypothetical protein
MKGIRPMKESSRALLWLRYFREDRQSSHQDVWRSEGAFQIPLRGDIHPHRVVMNPVWLGVTQQS